MYYLIECVVNINDRSPMYSLVVTRKVTKTNLTWDFSRVNLTASRYLLVSNAAQSQPVTMLAAVHSWIRSIKHDLAIIIIALFLAPT